MVQTDVTSSQNVWCRAVAVVLIFSFNSAKKAKQHISRNAKLSFKISIQGETKAESVLHYIHEFFLLEPHTPPYTPYVPLKANVTFAKGNAQELQITHYLCGIIDDFIM